MSRCDASASCAQAATNPWLMMIHDLWLMRVSYSLFLYRRHSLYGSYRTARTLQGMQIPSQSWQQHSLFCHRLSAGFKVSVHMHLVAHSLSLYWHHPPHSAGISRTMGGPILRCRREVQRSEPISFIHSRTNNCSYPEALPPGSG